jgi:hypothetical protein
MATGFLDSPVPMTARKETPLLPASLLRVCQVDERMSSYGAEHREDRNDYGGDDYDGERPELEATVDVTVSLEAEIVHRIIAVEARFPHWVWTALR